MENIGQILRAARERKKVDLSKAAALTRIKIQHLQMMESDDFSKMPAPTYAKGFIRIYANFLGLDPAPLIQAYIDKYIGPSSGKSESKLVTPAATTEPRETKSTEKIAARRRTLPTAAMTAALAEKVRQAGRLVYPYLPAVIVTLALILVISLIGRCVARIGSDTAETSSSETKLEGQAILQEPPVHYLDVPAAKGDQP